jgi:hypothetical protein
MESRSFCSSYLAGEVTRCVFVGCWVIRLLRSDNPTWIGLISVCDLSVWCSVWLLLGHLFRCVLEKFWWLFVPRISSTLVAT